MQTKGSSKSSCVKKKKFAYNGMYTIHTHLFLVSPWRRGTQHVFNANFMCNFNFQESAFSVHVCMSPPSEIYFKGLLLSTSLPPSLPQAAAAVIGTCARRTKDHL